MNNCAIASNCKSIFKSGENKLTPEYYTRIWIALINQVERNKQLLAGAR